MNTYYTGDDIAISGSLLKNGQPLAEGLTGTLACALVLPDRSAKAAGTSDVIGAIVDATACTFTALWPRAQTGTIVPGRCLVEIQLTQGDQVRTFQPAVVMIEKGVVV